MQELHSDSPSVFVSVIDDTQQSLAGYTTAATP